MVSASAGEYERRRECDAPLCAQLHVPRELSDGDHVGCLLELDHLLVNKPAPVVQNHVRVERAVLDSPRDSLGLALSRERSCARVHAAMNGHDERRPAAFALKVKRRCAGRQCRGRDDDSGQSDELGERVGLVNERGSRGGVSVRSAEGRRPWSKAGRRHTVSSRNWIMFMLLLRTACISGMSRSASVASSPWASCCSGCSACRAALSNAASSWSRWRRSMWVSVSKRRAFDLAD